METCTTAASSASSRASFSASYPTPSGGTPSSWLSSFKNKKLIHFDSNIENLRPPPVLIAVGVVPIPPQQPGDPTEVAWITRNW